MHVFDEWVARESPSFVVGRAVQQWIEGLPSNSIQFPSVPDSLMHDRPHWEIREAVVPESTVTVTYKVTFDADGNELDVELLGIDGP